MNPALLAAPLMLSADRITVDAAQTTGAGAVVVTLDDQVAEAVSFSLDVSTGMLTLVDGQWHREDGVLSFEQATIALGDLSGVLFEARFTGEHMVAEGEVLRVVDASTLQGDGVVVTVCGCETPTWDITARRVTVEVDEVARFVGGWIRVCERPLLPLPVGVVPLAERRTGFLLPEPGYNQYGVVFNAPFFWTLGPHADVTIAPEWRQYRGIRAMTAGRYAIAPQQGGEVDVAVGNDQQEDALRWAGNWQHGWQGWGMRTAADVHLQSDAEYRADYGTSFLARSTPFMESRLLVEGGPLQLQSDLFQPSQPTLQQLLGMAVVKPHSVGPVLVVPQARLDVFAQGQQPWQLSEEQLRGSGQLRVHTGHRNQWGRVLLNGEASASQWSDSERWAQGWMEGQARVSLWGDVGTWRHLAEVGVLAATGAATAQVSYRVPDERPPPLTGVGPVVVSQWLHAGGVPLSGTLQVPWTAEGWQPQGVARMRINGWQGRTQLSMAQQVVETGSSQHGHMASVAVARQAEIVQVGWQGALRFRGVTLGWHHLQKVADAQLLSTGPTLRILSPCDCLDVSARAAWSVDRQVPDVSVQVRID